MQLSSNGSVVDIMQRTLNHVDARLMDHGIRVAYIVYRMLKLQGKYDREQQRDLCFLAMIHDIGAYKTEEIDRMVQFETDEIWDHSIYGYLFVKYFSPLQELSPVLLFHHVDVVRLAGIPDWVREMAQIFNVADRADVFYQEEGRDLSVFARYLQFCRDTRFDGASIDLFLAADLRASGIDDLAADHGFRALMHDYPYTESEVEDYLKMIVLVIDFRSRHTVTHTITTASISQELALLQGLSQEETKRVVNGAMLHDLGKTGIPIEILESTGRLSDKQMAVMRTHVMMTENILADDVDPAIKCIAVRHHEKLDGSGYPRGLRAAELAVCERIVMVADIVSALCGVRSYKAAFPKDKIIGIIGEMSRDGLVDGGLIDTVIQNYDHIIDKVYEASAPVLAAYKRLSTEFAALAEATATPGADLAKLPGLAL